MPIEHGHKRYQVKKLEGNELMVLSEGINVFPLTLHLTTQTLHGELNKNYIWKDEHGNRFIQRIPIPDSPIISYINQDLAGSNFFMSGGSYRLRTILEQAAFIEMCVNKDLPVVAPLFWNNEEMISPLVNAFAFHHYLQQDGMKLIPKVISEAMRAHQQQVVYCDRWGPNTLVNEVENRVYEIDFDLELFGRWQKEFELAQILYHIVHFSLQREQVARKIVSHLLSSDALNNYDFEFFTLFLWGHAEGRKDHAYDKILADIRPEIELLLNALISG